MAEYSRWARRRPLPYGANCPVITPFTEDEEIDIPNLRKQVIRLANAGMGVTLLGTNGEANHLSSQERFMCIRAAREALDSAGHTGVPLLVGTGTGSAKETAELCKSAAEAGADYAMVVFPGYFAYALAGQKAVVKDFFMRIFEASPIPVMIYNFPKAAAGIDLDSDMIIELSEHPNCIGCKLTCGAIGKGARIAAHTSSAAYNAQHGPFVVLSGFSDFLLPALLAGHHGCITGTGNVLPKLIVKLYETSVRAIASHDPEDMEQAQQLQAIVSSADWSIVKAGIGGTKYALNTFIEPNLGGHTRSPIPQAGPAVQTMLAEALADALEIEASLPDALQEH